MNERNLPVFILKVGEPCLTIHKAVSRNHVGTCVNSLKETLVQETKKAEQTPKSSVKTTKRDTSSGLKLFFFFSFFFFFWAVSSVAGLDNQLLRTVPKTRLFPAEPSTFF